MIIPRFKIEVSYKSQSKNTENIFDFKIYNKSVISNSISNTTNWILLTLHLLCASGSETEIK